MGKCLVRMRGREKENETKNIRTFGRCLLRKRSNNLLCASKMEKHERCPQRISRDSGTSIYYNLHLMCTASETLWSTLQWNPQLRHPCFVNICHTRHIYCVCNDLIERLSVVGRNRTNSSGKADFVAVIIGVLENEFDPCPYMLMKTDGLVCTLCHSSPSLVFQPTCQTENAAGDLLSHFLSPLLSAIKMKPKMFDNLGN